ncbi:hypothetical protein QEN19_002820 [Hanseniaspora menglaensis]
MGPFDKKLKKFLSNSIRTAPKVPSVNDKLDINSLRDYLSSKYPQTRKDAVRRVIEQMTLGKDMSILFPDIVKNMGINNDDIELKKLIYLFIINYSLVKPEFMILVINSFLQDTLSDNPLIKCMALKTMCMLPMSMIIEYLEEPITNGLLSDNAYVRKTSIICLIKIYNYDLIMFEKICPTFLNIIYTEDNSMVLGNILHFLMELDCEKYINMSFTQYLNQNLEKLINILPECNEWSRISVLNCISKYNNKTYPLSNSQIVLLVNKVTPFLQHINPSIIMSSLKVLFNFVTYIEDDSGIKIWEKLSMGIISISNNPSFELQYILMKNLKIILKKLPKLYKYLDLKNFYLKLNDPIYLKFAKLEILDEMIVNNLTSYNLKSIVSEYKDYCNLEFNNEFIQTIINKLGNLMLLLDDNKYIDLKLDIIQFLTEEINYQNDAVMINLCKKISFNEKYSDCDKIILPWVLSNWESLLTDKSKAFFVNYIVSVHSEVSNFNIILNSLLENIADEGPETQLMLIQAMIRLENIDILNKIFKSNVFSIDIKELITFYQRLLETSNSKEEILKFLNLHQVQSDSKNNIRDVIPEHKLNYWFHNLGTLSSITYKDSLDDIPPRAKILYYQNNKTHNEEADIDLATVNDMIQRESNEMNLLEFEDTGNFGINENKSTSSGKDAFDDLLGLF